MNYKYPAELVIGGNRIKISIIDGVSTNCVEQHSADFLPSRNEIQLAVRSLDGLSKCLDFTNESLIHEIIEAVKVTYVVKIEEDDVERLAQGLWQVLSQLGIFLIKED